ncbi:MAG: hypothetical protein AAFQ11_00870, partial [Pseudomonadota bacterium]
RNRRRFEKDRFRRLRRRSADSLALAAVFAYLTHQPMWLRELVGGTTPLRVMSPLSSAPI